MFTQPNTPPELLGNRPTQNQNMTAAASGTRNSMISANKNREINTLSKTTQNESTNWIRGFIIRQQSEAPLTNGSTNPNPIKQNFAATSALECIEKHTHVHSHTDTV